MHFSTRNSQGPSLREAWSKRRVPAASYRCAAFTLVEMLTVLGVIVVLFGLMVPAFNAIKGGNDMTSAAYAISGAFENARTYALANNTYVWVGFFEEDGSRASTIPATAGTGRVVIALVASRDGTRYSDEQIDSATPPAFGTESPTASPPRNQVHLVLLSPVTKLNNTHLGTLNDDLSSSSANLPSRPPVPAAYQVGDATFAQHAASAGGTVPNPATFTVPLQVYGANPAPQYSFIKVVEFNPQGEASKMLENTFSGPGPQPELEVAFQPTHGSSADVRYTGNNRLNAAAAIQLEGLTGHPRIYRP